MMYISYIILAAASAMAVGPILNDQQSDEQAMIDYMNSGQPLYETGIPTMSYEDFESRLMDPKYLDSREEKLLRTAPIKLAAGQDDIDIPDNIDIPERFDAREEWPDCKSIKLIRDQGNCGSCWAVSVASVMSDRLCIASGQKIQKLLSATDIMACCDNCTSLPCAGSKSVKAWEYIKSHGVCSGGPYNRKNVCKPYVFRPCSYSKKEKMHYGPCNYDRNSSRPMCLKKCLQDYTTSYTEDKVYLEGNYYGVSPFEREIQKEIMKYGPVQASMFVYKTLYNYTSGIYFHKHNENEVLFGHAIKIIGWGAEKMKKDVTWRYWLVSNSWGTNWGEGGILRIVRGIPTFNGGIENRVYAGHPKTQ